MKVPIDSIIITERARKYFDKEKLEELSQSLQAYGLIQPIAITEGNVLISGHRRLLAAKALGWQEIEATVIPADEIRARELELEENLRRQDLQWKEVVRATAELHRLRKAQDPSWTMADTERAVGSGQVSIRLALAENLHRPDVAKATTEAEAARILRKALETEFRAALVAKNVLPTDVVIECAEASAGIRDYVPDESVDVLITDPPYGIEANKQGFHGGKDKHAYFDDSWERTAVVISNALKAALPKLRPAAHLYLFCAFDRLNFLMDIIDSLGWQVWPRPLIWVKNVGTAPAAEHGPLYSYECIIFATRGGRKVAVSRNDTLIYKIEPGVMKPVPLIRDLLERSVLAGDTVLDPFCGSGTVARAALELKCRAYCFDLDPMQVAIAREGVSL